MLVRIITGVVLAVYATLVIIIGGPLLLWSAFGLTIVSAYELLIMLKKNHKPVSVITSLFFIFLVFVAITFFDFKFIALSLPFKLIILSFIVYYFIELLTKKINFPNINLILTLRVIIFFLGTMTFIFLIRNGANGIINLLYVSILIWVFDTFSLFG
ncbi:MAG: phosphatidate cytidylyltransferase, partial [Candidatus Margulisiibacteriota bacterium]